MRSPRVLVVAVLAFVGFYLLRLGMASSLSGGVQALALLAGAGIAVNRDRCSAGRAPNELHRLTSKGRHPCLAGRERI